MARKLSNLEIPEDTVATDDVSRFLGEDLGTGDLTTAIIPRDFVATARVTNRELFVLCGQNWFSRIFTKLDSRVEIDWKFEDGMVVPKDAVICTLQGNARALVTGERTALNLLQTLSGTATTAKGYADAVHGTGVTIMDTRKTLPGLRMAQKYAVRCGGCENHRFGLFDEILIKENHIAAVGSIKAAVAKARRLHGAATVEIEVESLDELKQALGAGVEKILLDNFEVASLKEAVLVNNHRAKLEASGNITLDNIRTIAETGVDYISIGALTKNVQAIDISMRINLLA